MQASSVNSPVSRPESWLIRVNARAKILVCLAAALFSLLFSDWTSIAVLFAGSFFYLLCTKHWRMVGTAYALLALMMLMAAGFTMGMTHFVPMLKKELDPMLLSIPFMRGAVMMNVVLPLAFFTRVQHVLHVLQSMKLPFPLYLPAAVMVRFIPTFANDVKEVWEALKIRGHVVTPWRALMSPIKTTRILLAPLLFRSLRTSDDLGIAAELKGLGTRSRYTPYAESRWQKTDFLFLAAALLILTAACTAEFMAPIAITSGSLR